MLCRVNVARNDWCCGSFSINDLTFAHKLNTATASTSKHKKVGMNEIACLLPFTEISATMQSSVSIQIFVPFYSSNQNVYHLYIVLYIS
jgi:hypothetical protein